MSYLQHRELEYETHLPPLPVLPELKNNKRDRKKSQDKDSAKPLAAYEDVTDASRARLVATIRHLSRQLSNESMPEDARSSLRFRLQTTKDELYSQDPLLVRVSKMQSAIARAEASLAKMEKALFDAKQERDKAWSHLDELRPGQQKLTHEIAESAANSDWQEDYYMGDDAGGWQDPHPGVVPAMCLGIITPRTSVRRVLTTAIRRRLV